MSVPERCFYEAEGVRPCYPPFRRGFDGRRVCLECWEHFEQEAEEPGNRIDTE